MQRSKRALVGIALIISFALSSFVGLTSVRVATALLNPIVQTDPPIIVLPYSNIGDVAIGVKNFTGVYGFQFKIWWLKDVVEFIGYEWKPDPPEWPMAIKMGPAFDENATHKAVMFAIAAMPPSLPFTYPDLWRFIDIQWHCIRANADSPLVFDRTRTMLVDEMGMPIPIGQIIDGLVINPPPTPPMFWKANYVDYAPSGVPDFDQRQDLWNVTRPGFWSWCTPTAVANSLWWMDSRYENGITPPPTRSDTFPLVSNYTAGIDDHDPANVVPLIAHLGYLMDTDGNRTGLPHVGTNVFDTQAGIAHYLSWTGVNPKGDVNGDGVVDNTDLAIVQAAFGTMPGMPGWNLAADIWPVTRGWPNRGVADNKVDLKDLDLVAQNFGSTGMFYEKTVQAPDFYFVEEEVERSEDVVLMIGFYYDGTRENDPYEYGSGHSVTVAGVNSTALKIGLSDPIQNNAEAGGPGRILPQGVAHNHPALPPDAVHNNASFVSHDVYNVNLALPPLPHPAKFSLINYTSPQFPGATAVVEWAVIVSPIPPQPPPPQPPPERLIKLIDIVNWPGTVIYAKIPFEPDLLARFTQVQGFPEIKLELETKGYEFTNYATGEASEVTVSAENETIHGIVLSWWSNNTLFDGTRAFIAATLMDDNSSMVFGVSTNLLPPEQVPEVDPHIIVNAMPYMYVRFYWWAWYPIGRIISWYYWWYDSHSHPNWFWGPWWWWRIWIRGWTPFRWVWVNFKWVLVWPFPWAFWRPWWGWWWHWLYWRHWYWWSTYFPYDP